MEDFAGMSQIKVFLNFNLHVVSESIPHSLLSLMVLVHQCSGIFWVDFPSNTLESRVAPVEQETQTEDAGKCQYLEGQSTAAKSP